MEMITIRKENEKQVVSARELYDFLGVKKDFSSWIQGRVVKYDFKRNEDYTTVSLIPQIGGIKRGGDRKSIDYLITLEMAKELCMVENNQKGREARQYFIECEKKYVESLEKKLEPTNDAFINQMEQDLRKAKELENQIELIVKELKGLYDNIYAKSRWKSKHYYETVAVAKGKVSHLTIDGDKFSFECDL